EADVGHLKWFHRSAALNNDVVADAQGALQRIEIDDGSGTRHARNAAASCGFPNSDFIERYIRTDGWLGVEIEVDVCVAIESRTRNDGPHLRGGGTGAAPGEERE